MARNQPTFEFKPGSLGVNLKRFDNDVDALVAAVVDYRMTKGVGWMRTTAKWKDRTGNARQTLTGYVLHKAVGFIGRGAGYIHEIHFHGGVPYQIWLEVRWAGRYAIIGPAVKYQGLALMNQLRGLMNKLTQRSGGGSA